MSSLPLLSARRPRADCSAGAALPRLPSGKRSAGRQGAGAVLRRPVAGLFRHLSGNWTCFDITPTKVRVALLKPVRAPPTSFGAGSDVPATRNHVARWRMGLMGSQPLQTHRLLPPVGRPGFSAG